MMKSPYVLRNIPSVAELLESPQIKALVDRVNHHAVVRGVRSIVTELRGELQRATADLNIPSISELAERIANRILSGDIPAARPVINATGVVLPAALGRAPLAEEAIQDLVGAAREFTSCQLNLETGDPADRERAVTDLLKRLTGCEAAWVVCSHAGATLLAMSALASGREVIVSRGQLVETGDDFRLPDLIRASGALLREVGATNKTTIGDYQAALGPSAAVLLRVPPSNFCVVGATAEASLAELVGLGRRRNVPVVDDLASAALMDLASCGVAAPLAATSIETGADLVLFSGDRLVGGPQCGIIVGRRALVEQLAAHPIARALRIDKLALSALAGTLRIYRHPDQALEAIPLFQLLSTSIDNLKNRAERLAPQLAACSLIKSATAVASTADYGGDGLAAQQIPTWCVALEPATGDVSQLAKTLRSGSTSIISRIQDDRLLIDLRSVFPRQDCLVAAAFEKLNMPADSPSETAAAAEPTANSAT